MQHDFMTIKCFLLSLTVNQFVQLPLRMVAWQHHRKGMLHTSQTIINVLF